MGLSLQSVFEVKFHLLVQRLQTDAPSLRRFDVDCHSHCSSGQLLTALHRGDLAKFH